MLVVESHHIRRAHRALIFLTAHACAVAQFHSSRKTAFAREVIMRVDGNGMVFGSVTEVLRHGRSVYDLARIHPVFGVERSLDVLERFIELRSEQFFVQVTTRESVAMFTAHPATEFHD